MCLNCLNNATDGVFSVSGIALVLRNAFPVPLVHVNGVHRACSSRRIAFISQTATNSKVSARVHSASILQATELLGVLAYVWQVKSNRMLNAIEVVIHAERVSNQRSSDAQRSAQRSETRS